MEIFHGDSQHSSDGSKKSLRSCSLCRSTPTEAHILGGIRVYALPLLVGLIQVSSLGYVEEARQRYGGHGRAPGILRTRSVPMLQFSSSKEYFPWISASDVCEAITGLSFNFLYSG